MYCMPCKNATTVCTVLRFLQTYYVPTTHKLRENYKTSTVVLLIKIRSLRYFYDYDYRVIRYVNFFLAPTVHTFYNGHWSINMRHTFVHMSIIRMYVCTYVHTNKYSHLVIFVVFLWQHLFYQLHSMNQ